MVEPLLSHAKISSRSDLYLQLHLIEYILIARCYLDGLMDASTVGEVEVLLGRAGIVWHGQ